MKHKYETKMRKMQRKEIFVKRLTTLFIYTCLILTIVFLSKENKELKVAVDAQQQLYESTIFEKNYEIANLNYKIDGLEEVVNELDEQISNVSEVNKSYVDELNYLRSREELYDKYEYAIMYDGKRTELKYEEIQYGEELMLAKGHNPNLMFGSIMVESRANPVAVNKESGATGYGQFLDSTAKWVWTKLIGNNSYYSDIRKDGKANIQMMAEYYDYLYGMYGNNTLKVVKHYSGNSTYEGASTYLAKVNSFTRKVGEVIN